MLFRFINLCCRGGGQAVQGGLSSPPHLGIMFNFFLMLISLVSNFLYIKLYHLYNHNSSQIELFSLSFVLIPLVAGVGGKLSRAVYLAPHMADESYFFFTWFKYLNMKLIH